MCLSIMLLWTLAKFTLDAKGVKRAPVTVRRRFFWYRMLRASKGRSMDPDTRRMKEMKPLECCACYVLKGHNLNYRASIAHRHRFSTCTWPGGAKQAVPR